MPQLRPNFDLAARRKVVRFLSALVVMAPVQPARKFGFIFPMASGHINPSLPVARTLVEEGHEVNYLCREQMKEAIEDTGATFHSEIEALPEMYEGRQIDIFGCLTDLQKEYGLEDDPLFIAMFKLREIMQELMLPGILRWLREVQAEVVVICPLMNKEACWAAQILSLPCVGIMTTAGPGSLPYAMTEWLEQMGYTPERCLEEWHGLTVTVVVQASQPSTSAKPCRLIQHLMTCFWPEERRAYQPVVDAIERLRDTYGLEITIDEEMVPLGVSVVALRSALTLVTTVEFLADPLSPELEKVYEEARTQFVYVGPLLDKAGAKRAAGHKFQSVEEAKAEDSEDPLSLLRKARAAGRKVIFASMGTVITGDSPEIGWANRMSVDNVLQGLTGKELCQAAWGGLFDAVGSDSSDAPLLLLSLGPQPDALENLPAPPNVFCLPVMPQVDILKEGVDMFLTHGGQNSFMESLSTGTPVVVCPGFADQPVNANKAVQLGVGLQVERPMCDLSEAKDVAAKYRQEVATAVKEVLSNPSFKSKAADCASKMQLACSLLELDHRAVSFYGADNIPIPWAHRMNAVAQPATCLRPWLDFKFLSSPQGSRIPADRARPSQLQSSPLLRWRAPSHRSHPPGLHMFARVP